MEFGEMIKAARQRSGLSQSGLAQLLVSPKRPDGVWSTYVGQIESGEKLPSEEICLQLARVLDLNPLRLLLLSYRTRAEEPAAGELLDQLLAAAEDPDLALLLQEDDPDAEALFADLAGDGMRELLEQEGMGGLLGQLSRAGRIAAVSGVLARVAALDESEWETLMAIVRSPAFSQEQR